MISDNNEEIMDKEIFGQLWDNLAANLNNIGPPMHTVVEWKKIWSSHKYYKNRKRSSTASLHTDEHGKKSRLDQSDQLAQVNVAIDAAASDVGQTIETVPIQSEFLVKINVIIANQTSMIANQNAMIANQNVLVDEVKALVQILAKKA